MIKISYKEKFRVNNYYLKEIDDDVFANNEIDKKKVGHQLISDSDVSLRIHNNLKLLQESEETFAILKSLYEDMKFSPGSILLFHPEELVKSLSFELSNPKNPLLLLKIVYVIMKYDDRCYDLLSEYIWEIYNMIPSEKCSKIGAFIVSRILECSENGASKLVYDGFLESVKESIDNETPLVNILMGILELTVQKCNKKLFTYQNNVSLMIIIHRILAQYKDKYLSNTIPCFRKLIKYSNLGPRVILPQAIFNVIVENINKLDISNIIRIFYLFNEVLIHDNDFFIEHLYIINLLDQYLNFSDACPIIFRLLGNFSYIEGYANYIIDHELYQNIFTMIAQEVIPFKYLDDPLILFCRLCAYNPSVILELQYFYNLLSLSVQFIESSHSEFFENSFKTMLERLSHYFQTHSNFAHSEAFSKLCEIIQSNETVSHLISPIFPPQDI